jgi:GNAT superfamily N-acetyltransferase
MTKSLLKHRLATRADLPALMDRAISELQKPFLTAEQIGSSRTIMGLDTQLIEDKTYFVIEQDGAIAGCGGWSRRATLYGGDRSPGRDAALLDPATDPARVRAMYTHPDFMRRGVGRLILTLCEERRAPKVSSAPNSWQPWQANRSIVPADTGRWSRSSIIGAESEFHCYG